MSHQLQKRAINPYTLLQGQGRGKCVSAKPVPAYLLEGVASALDH